MDLDTARSFYDFKSVRSKRPAPRLGRRAPRFCLPPFPKAFFGPWIFAANGHNESKTLPSENRGGAWLLHRACRLRAFTSSATHHRSELVLSLTRLLWSACGCAPQAAPRPGKRVKSLLAAALPSHRRKTPGPSHLESETGTGGMPADWLI